MLEAKYIREHLDEVRDRRARRGQAVNFDQFLLIDGERRKNLQEWERLRALQKKVSDEVSKKKKEGQEASELIAEMKKVSQEMKDLDVVVQEKEKALQDFLQNLVSIDTKDFFDFIIGNTVLDLENAPYGGYRFPIESRMAGRVFIKFEVDIAAGDTWLEPHGRVKTQDWFGFAGIEAPMIPVISQEQQFAEKMHAYTLPRKTPNSRVKDLVDILLLIENDKLKTDRVKNALSKTFKRRNTHPIPPDLPKPPESWKTPFRKMAQTCGILEDISFAMDKIRQFYKTLTEERGEETIPG